MPSGAFLQGYGVRETAEAAACSGPAQVISATPEPVLPVGTVGESVPEAPPLSSEELRQRVERVARRVVYFCHHAHEWDEAKYAGRLNTVCEDVLTLYRELQFQGKALADGGWCIAPNGHWHPVDEDPTEAADPEQAALIDAAYTVLSHKLKTGPETPRTETPAPRDERGRVLALAGEKGYPGLYGYGRYAGAGEDIWKRFTEICHPAWLPLAVGALNGYSPPAVVTGATDEEVARETVLPFVDE